MCVRAVRRPAARCGRARAGLLKKASPSQCLRRSVSIRQTHSRLVIGPIYLTLFLRKAMGETTEKPAAEVQAELQLYLNSKNINALFISIVEAMLIEKPSNPIAFVIEYLANNYPDQSKIALDALSSKISQNVIRETEKDSKVDAINEKSEKVIAVKSESQPSPILAEKAVIIDAAAAEALEEGRARAVDESDDDDEPDIDEYVAATQPVTPIRKSPSKSRRPSVSAESSDPSTLQARLQQVPRHPQGASCERATAGGTGQVPAPAFDGR
ncbi:unnamed protein product [Sphagnum jensenii]|uniref:Uncharacterized protein n=1 Tax=Sphagnum jensenii TaxID=128206 RepID=A0ABP0VFS9_9BRYO